MSFDSNIFGSGLGGFLGGLFGHSDKPYDKAMEQYQKYMQMGQQTQQPYLNAGQDSIVNYQNWLQNQQNPSQFINNQMENYQESPWAQNMQQQSINAGQNAASASGLMGSTPLMQALQQNAGTIASQDQNNWLQKILGINSQYGQGQNNLMTGGKNAANALATLYNQMGQQMGEAAYGKEAGKNQDFWNTIGGGLNMIKGFGFL